MVIKLYIYYSFSLSAEILVKALHRRDGRKPASADKHRQAFPRASASGSISPYISMCVLRQLLYTDQVVKRDDKYCISTVKLHTVGASGND